MDATTTAPSARRRRADLAALTVFRHRSVIHRLPSRRLKSPKAGQFCTIPLQYRDPGALRPADNAAFFRCLRLVSQGLADDPVAWDLISCCFSNSGRACPPPVGKGVSDTEQRQASARVTVVCGRIGNPGAPDPKTDDPRRPSEPPDTPQTPPDEPFPTPVKKPLPGNAGPYVAGLDPG